MVPKGINRTIVAVTIYSLLGGAFTAYSQQPEAPAEAEPRTKPETTVDAEPPPQPEKSNEAEPPPQTETPTEDEPPPSRPEILFETKLERKPEKQDEKEPSVEPESTPGKTLSAIAPPKSDEQIHKEEEIVITGSRIKRTVFSTASPVQVIDRKELEYSGADSASDVIQYLTASTGHAFAGRYSLLTTGTSQVNLRGLGAGGTLVLLNSRRVVPTGAPFETNYVDLNTIPISAIERIEILRGGASAIYGADAVAGVINIITRRDFDGVRAEGGVKVTSKFDQHEGDANLAIGATGERGSVIGGLSYQRRTPLFADERDFTKGTTVSQAGNPATFWVPGAGPPFVEEGALPLIPDPACERVEHSSIDADGLCVFDFGPSHSIIGEEERVNTYGNMEYDLTHHTRVFGELGYARARNLDWRSPAYPPAYTVTIPADHVDNPFGLDATYIGRPLGYDAGSTVATSESDTIRTVVGLRGDFEGAAQNTVFEDWEWTLFGTWGTTSFVAVFEDNLMEPFVEAINSCSDPNDLSGCFNPFYSAIDGTGTPNSQEVIDSFSGKMIGRTDSTLWTLDAGLTGSVLELPGGDLGFAAGTQYRNEFRASLYDHDANQFAYGFLMGYRDRDAQRDIVSGYAELTVPFLSGIELQPAGRIEHYSDVGSSVNPKVGLILTPSDIIGRQRTAEAFHNLLLRVVWASAFRAPALFQTTGAFTAPESFQEPGQATEVFRPVVLYGNPDLVTEKANAISTGFDWTPMEQLSLETDFWYYDYDDIIVRENAQQIFMNQDDPRVILDENGRLVRVETSYNNASNVTATGLDFGVTIRLKLEDFGVRENFGRLSLGARGTYIHEYNIPRQDVADITLEDDTEVEPPDCDGDRCDVSGKRNWRNFANPLQKLRVNFPISWSLEGHVISLIVHFIGGYLDDQNYDSQGNYKEIDSFTTLDLQYSYTLIGMIGAATTFRLGVANLFDEQPPFVDTEYGYDTLTHDPRGRLIYARLAQEF